MSVVVPRTCTVIADGDAEPSRDGNSRPLEEFRSTPAYVLLGDPGSGKSTAFETECKAHGEDDDPVSARDFRALPLDRHPEWGAKTLFIDGLDEVRAGSLDARKFERSWLNLDAMLLINNSSRSYSVCSNTALRSQVSSRFFSTSFATRVGFRI